MLVPLCLVILCARTIQEAPQEPVFMGRAFLFRADLEAGRAMRWIAPGVSDDEALSRIEQTLRARKRNSGRFVEGQVLREPDAVFSVTFVGPMADAMEAMLIDGLSRPARLALATLATDGDLEGTTIREERERLRAWLAADVGREMARFVSVPRQAGGPFPGLAWVPPRRRKAEHPASAALPILSGESLVLRRADLERAAGVRGTEAGGMSLVLRPGGELRARLGERLADGCRHRYLVDGVGIAEALPLASYEEIRIDAFTLDELRGLVLALAGEPLAAPLRFVGRDTRPLQSVVLEGDD